MGDRLFGMLQLISVEAIRKSGAVMSSLKSCSGKDSMLQMALALPGNGHPPTGPVRDAQDQLGASE